MGKSTKVNKCLHFELFQRLTECNGTEQVAMRPTHRKHVANVTRRVPIERRRMANPAIPMRLGIRVSQRLDVAGLHHHLSLKCAATNNTARRERL